MNDAETFATLKAAVQKTAVYLLSNAYLCPCQGCVNTVALGFDPQGECYGVFGCDEHDELTNMPLRLNPNPWDDPFFAEMLARHDERQRIWHMLEECIPDAKVRK